MRIYFGFTVARDRSSTEPNEELSHYWKKWVSKKVILFLQV
jgi:hypothetical protein